MKKKYISLILALTVFITSSLAVSPALAAKAKYVDYNPNRYGDITANVVMRKSATSKSASLGTIPKNKRLLLYGYYKYPSSSWYKVKYNNKLGYISSKYAKLSYKAYSPKIKGKTTANLYIRSGVGLKYKKKKYIKKGTTITLNGYYRTAGYDWYKVAYGKTTGYLSSKYVKRISTQPKPKWVNYNPNRNGITSVNTSFKKTSSSGSSTICNIPVGTRVSLYGYDKYTNGSWYKANYNGSIGYISANDCHLDYRSYSPNKPGITTANLYMRSGVGLNYSKKIYIPKGSTISLYGYYSTARYDWYKINYKNKTGYISSKYVKRQDGSVIGYVDSSFPTSYQKQINALHQQYPSWNFYAKHISVPWETIVSEEYDSQYIHENKSDAWKSMEEGSYDFEKNKFEVHDSKWHKASEDIVKYYLDPRNFLNEDSIYQFMSHELNLAYQTKDTVAKGVVGSFMDTTTYINTIYNSGLNSNVNPNVIVSMLINEQGWNGGNNGLVSGNYPGYKGYYNFFNIGAYAHSGKTATVNGLIYAKKQGWNTPEKSITAGGKFYSENYVTKNQNTFYTKKFNVMNGVSKMGGHEYCTNVEAGQSEGKLLSRGFNDLNTLPLTFYIPVYTNMPSSPAPKPSTYGNNNNVLKSLSISYGDTILSSTTQYTNLNVSVPKNVKTLTINAVPYDSNATVISGAGNISLTGTDATEIKYVKVKSSSGKIRTYTVTINKVSNDVLFDPYRYVNIKIETKLLKTPGDVNSTIETIPKVSKIPALGFTTHDNKVWYKINYNNKTGYVAASDLKLTYTAYVPERVGSTDANLYIRSNIGLSYPKIKYLKKGSIVTVHGYYSTDGYDWFKITYKGVTGYISSKHVTF